MMSELPHSIHEGEQEADDRLIWRRRDPYPLLQFLNPLNPLAWVTKIRTRILGILEPTQRAYGSSDHVSRHSTPYRPHRRTQMADGSGQFVTIIIDPSAEQLTSASVGGSPFAHIQGWPGQPLAPMPRVFQGRYPHPNGNPWRPVPPGLQRLSAPAGDDEDLEAADLPVCPEVHWGDAKKWAKLVVPFCLAVPLQYLNLKSPPPAGFSLYCLAVLMAFAFFVVSSFINPRFDTTARVLARLGVFFMVAAFFQSITLSSPLCVTVIGWAVCAISLAAVLGSYCF